MHGKLDEKASTKETIKQIIKEIQEVGTTTVRPAEGTIGKIADEPMDIESRKNNIIIYWVHEDPQSSYLTQDTQHNTKDISSQKNHETGH